MFYAVWSDEKHNGRYSFIKNFDNLAEAECCAVQRKDYYGAYNTHIVVS